MAEFEAKVRLRVRQPDDGTDMMPTDFVTSTISDPDLGVLVLGVDELAALPSGEYGARVHVHVRQKPPFKTIKPEDFVRIHMTDEDFGLSVVDVEIIQEIN
jgi:hypothetical protein